MDPAWVLIPLAGIGALAWTLGTARPPAAVHFPREPERFKASALLVVEEQAGRAALEKDPEDLRALVELGVVLFQRGPGSYLNAAASPEKPWEFGAVQLLERARDLGALDVRIFFYLGAIYEATGLPEYAVTEFERFLRHSPEDLETRLRLGNLYYKMEETDRSISQYRRVLEARPGDPLVSYNLALALREKEDWAAGLEALGAVRAAGRPLPSGGHRLLGDLLRGNKEPERALEAYALELKESGDSASLAEAMARALEDLKRTDQAVERWETVLRLDPEHREAKARLRKLRAPKAGRRR